MKRKKEYFLLLPQEYAPAGIRWQSKQNTIFWINNKDSLELTIPSYWIVYTYIVYNNNKDDLKIKRDKTIHIILEMNKGVIKIKKTRIFLFKRLINMWNKIIQIWPKIKTLSWATSHPNIHTYFQINHKHISSFISL